MGTSSSNPGPPDKRPLLPPWALPPDSGNPDKPDAPSPPDEKNSDKNLPPTPPGTWKAAKGAMSRFAGSGSSKHLANAGRAYVGAKGGRKGAADSAYTGKAATINLGAFLSDVARQGIGQTLQKLGLAHMVGRSAQEVFAALLDVLAPSGTTSEQMAARIAVDNALEWLYEEYIESGSLESLDNISEEGIIDAIEASIAGYIYTLWLDELGIRIETYTISPQKAVALERDTKEYVKERVKLELESNDPLSIDWHGSEGRSIIDSIFHEAYGFLEVG